MIPLTRSVILILLGPPGSGKGTQAKLLSEALHLPHISTGDLFREHIQNETELGKQAKQYLDSGQLVPDELVINMVVERIKRKDCSNGCILDGFPRTLSQAKALQSFLPKGTRPLVAHLALSDALVLARFSISKRMICLHCATPYDLTLSPPKKSGLCDRCQSELVQRPDDSETVIQKRLQVYHAQTSPLIDFYTQMRLLHAVDCSASKEEIFKQLMSLVKTQRGS